LKIYTFGTELDFGLMPDCSRDLADIFLGIESMLWENGFPGESKRERLA